MRGEGERAEQSENHLIAHVETTRIGAESRHHQPPTVGRETAPAHRAAALGDARHRMQMSGDLAVLRLFGGLVAKGPSTAAPRG